MAPRGGGEQALGTATGNGFGVRVSEGDGGLLLEVRGALDGSTASRLRDALTELVDQGRRRIVLDVREMRFAEFTAVGVFSGALRKLRHQGADVVIHAPTRTTYKVLARIGLTRVVTVERPDAGPDRTLP